MPEPPSLIDKLEFLTVLARERNFRRAAAACGVAQPTLSAAIKALEEQLGALLVRRSSRFQGFTPEGELVLARAHLLVADARALRDELLARRRGLVGHLAISCIPTALSVAPTLTGPFQALHPGVRVTVRARSSAETLADLHSFDADAGVTYTGNEAIGRVRAVPLYAERYCLLTAAGGPGDGRDDMTWAEAAALPLCLPTGDMQNRRIVDRLLDPANAGRPCAMESDSAIALLAQVRAGGYATVLARPVAELVAGGGPFRTVALTEPDAAFAVGLVVPDRMAPSPIVSAFLSFVERSAPPS